MKNIWLWYLNNNTFLNSLFQTLCAHHTLQLLAIIFPPCYSCIPTVITLKHSTDALNWCFGNKNISHQRVRPFQTVIGMGQYCVLAGLRSSHQPLSSRTPLLYSLNSLRYIMSASLTRCRVEHDDSLLFHTRERYVWKDS